MILRNVKYFWVKSQKKGARHIGKRFPMVVLVIFQGNAMHKVMQIEGCKNFAVEYTSQYCMVSRLRNIRKGNKEDTDT